VRWTRGLSCAPFISSRWRVAAVVPAERDAPDRERIRGVARRFGYGTLVAWHIRRPTWHAIEAAIFVISLAIVWLGVSLAH
jgi:hypothetical protein